MVTSASKQNTESESAGEFEDLAIANLVLDNNIREVSKTDPKTKELAEGIAAVGVIVPILVRPHPTKVGKDQVVHGHRRVLGSDMADKKTIPGRRQELTDAQVLEIQMQENLQREDMTEIDQARAFKRYLEETKCTQVQLAEKIGKSQPFIANRLRLLDLRPEIQENIRRGILSASHGEVLLKVPKEMSGVQGSLAKSAQARKMTVQELGHEVDRAVEHYEEKSKVAAAIKEHGHGKCPTCKLPAVEIESQSVYGGAKGLYFRCSRYHDWNAKTGKSAQAEYNEKYQPSYSGGSRARSRPAKKAPPPQPKTWRSLHDASAIAKNLVRLLDDKTIHRVRLESGYSGGGNGGGELRIYLSKMPVKGLQFVVEPQAYSTGERSRVEAVGYNDGKRKEMRMAFESWSKAALPKPKATTGPKKQADPKILDGSIDEVCRKLPKDAELLESLRALEMKGKKRKSLLDHLDLKLSMRR